MPRSFAVTFDYRCPFARNAHEAVISGLADGAEWDVRFRAFSLDQAHVAAGEKAVWDRPEGERGTGVLALQWGLAVRDYFPLQFVDFHLAVFAARHDHGRRIDDIAVLEEVAAGCNLDPVAVAATIAEGGPLVQLATEHTELVEGWSVFGVPTFVSGSEAVFARLMERNRPDDVERVLDLLGWERLNEFKRTTIPR